MLGFTLSGAARLWFVPALALMVASCAKPDPSIPVGSAAYAVMPPPVPNGAPHEYLIGALDTININVFQEEDLTLQNVQVDAAGNIVMPLIGAVHAAHKTTEELARDISGRLRRFLVDPQVSVIVSTSVSQKVTVDGSVEQPGVYAIQGRTTLIDALAMAHGTTRVAALDQVLIFRDIGGQPAAARFDVAKIRQGKLANPEIVGNDVVVVGFSNVKGVYRDIIAASGLIGPAFYLLGRQ